MQHDLIYNRSGSLLDLVFPNAYNVDVKSEICPLLLLDSMYHPALKIELAISLVECLSHCEQFYDFINFNYDSIRSSIALLDWNVIFNGLDINDAVNVFYDYIFIIINNFFPLKIIHSNKQP